MIKSNGGIIGPDNVTTGGAFGSASGVFKLGEVTNLIKESKWPTAGPQGFQVANSARFNRSSSDYLTRSTGTPDSRRKATFSVWVKRGDLSSSDNMDLFCITTNSTDRMHLRFQGDDIDFYESGTNDRLTTDRKFRDVSAWYHIVLALDSTQGTASNRMKLYINGVQETSFSTATYPSENYDFPLNFANTQIGKSDVTNAYFGGYMSEVLYLDGTAAAVTDLGEFNSQTGIWVPKVVTGLTFGNNGYYLPFTNSGALGEDFSGEDNDFTANNLTSLDQSTDTCSTNFATLNSLIKTTSTISEGNLQYTSPGSNPVFGSLSSIGMSQGKWYGEVNYASGSNHYLVLGVADENFQNGSTTSSYDLGKSGTTSSIAYVVNTGAYRINNSNTSWGSAGGDGQIIMWAIDRVNNKIYFGVNGVWGASSDPAANTGGIPTTALDSSTDWFIGCTNDTSGTETVAQFNFGSPNFAISSGNTDGNGFGNFEYAPPSGFLSLNTKNLAAVLA